MELNGKQMDFYKNPYLDFGFREKSTESKLKSAEKNIS